MRPFSYNRDELSGCNSAVECLLPKQDVTGSNPATRSITHDRDLAFGSVTKAKKDQKRSLAGQAIHPLLSRYELAASAAGLSSASISHTVRCVTYFTRFLGADRDAGAVGPDDFRLFLADLRRRHVWQEMPHAKSRLLSATSINTYARAIRAFWSWMEREGVLRFNPLREVPAPRLPRRLPKSFTEHEVKQILFAASGNPRSQAMTLLLLDSGIRLGEITGLTLPDIDIKTCRLRVYGKGGKERFAYFSKRTAEALGRYIAQRPVPRKEDRLFLNLDGTPMDKRRISRVLVLIGKSANLNQRLSPHKLRHTFATLSLRFGNNLEYLRLALGHSDIETTSKSYLAACDADVALAQHRSSPITNLFRER